MPNYTPLDYIILYLVFFNVLEFILFSVDNRRRKRDEKRLPVKTLLAVAALGGGLGGICAVYFYHQYDRPYAVGFPLMVAAHVLILFFILRALGY